MIFFSRRTLRSHLKRSRTSGDEENETGESSCEEIDESLIVSGKRKRAQVDYRALNAKLFASAADSDTEESGDYKPKPKVKDGNKDGDDEGQEEEDAHEGDQDDDDEEMKKPKVQIDSITTGRQKRKRNQIDYRLLDSGGLSEEE